MSSVLLPVVVALIAAVLVLAVAARDAGSSRGLLSDLRAGLRRGPSDLGVLSSARADLAAAADVEVSRVEDLFDLGAPLDQRAPTHDELADELLRVTRSAARGVQGLVRR